MHKATEAGKKQFAGHELPGRTLGVIGLGAIGSYIAEAAIKLGMNVVGFDPGDHGGRRVAPAVAGQAVPRMSKMRCGWRISSPCTCRCWKPPAISSTPSASA
jgi:glutamate dehydrogenase/leucine dehydrogenase